MSKKYAKLTDGEFLELFKDKTKCCGISDYIELCNEIVRRYDEQQKQIKQL